MNRHESFLHTQAEIIEQDKTILADKQENVSSWDLPGIIPATPALSIDASQLELESRNHSQYLFTLSQGLSERLEILARAENTTIFILLLAAFQALLQRYSDQDEFVIGTCYADKRIEDATRPRILPGNLFSNPDFRELLRWVQAMVSEQDVRGDVPLTPPVETLQAEAGNATSFKKAFVFGTTLLGELEPGESDHILPVENDWVAGCELALIVLQTEQGLKGRVEYQPHLYEIEAIARLVEHWQMLLEGIVTDPTQHISELPLLTGSERQQILVEWNETAANYSHERCIHQLFEAQAERNPDGLAVMYQETALTYRDLNRRANQLAHYLQQNGVGPEVLVGLCLERSLEMIIGVLGVLKAGGAYVPFDPAYPPERISFMLADAQVSLLLTQERLHVDMPEKGMKIVYLDKDWDKISLEREENPLSGVTAENVAYVIYTSGSTGSPKGVVIQHQSLVNYVEFAGDTYNLTPNDRVLQFASLSFDASAEEIYPCLVKGSVLVLRTSSMTDSISLFLQKCQEWAITVLDLPTAFWHELVRKLDTEDVVLPSSLRLVIIGGERASPEWLAAWQKRVKQPVQVVNTYGPTEATIVVTTYKIPTSIRAMSREIPIGRAIANVQTYILDRYLNPVPIGIPGELYIGGIGLAREYFNRPTLTTQKFIPHPFSAEPGTRLYKTGDRARYLSEGNIEFLGRLDQQVKIRGYRIELGEIESILERHQDVQEAVVVAREDELGNKQLVVYVVPLPDRLVTSNALRQYVQEKLPDYMVPSVFVLLKMLPLTPGGKVDRRSLPAPELGSSGLPGTYVAPTGETQQQLVQIWEELLSVRPIGIRSNFFELGGHSLLAVRLIDRIEQVWRKRISAATLLAGATIEELASVLEKSEVPSAQAPSDTIKARLPKESSIDQNGQRFSIKSAWTRLIGKHKD